LKEQTVPITIEDTQLQRAAEDGLKEAIRTQLSNGYGTRDKVGAVITKVMSELEADGRINRIIRDHIITALGSPAVQQAVQQAVVKNIADKVGGAFQGVLIAAAKQMANSPEMQEAVRRLAADVVQGAKS
jgi:hypothetical protein